MSAPEGAGSIVLVPATNADAEMLAAMVSQFHEEEGVQLSDQARLQSIATLLSNPDFGKILCITDADNTVIGYAVLAFGYSLEFCGRDAFLDEIYLKPAHRGAGLGTRALNAVSDWARQNGLKALHLEVARTNTSAKALYERHGFEDRERYHLMSQRFAGET